MDREAKRQGQGEGGEEGQGQGEGHGEGPGQGQQPEDSIAIGMITRSNRLVLSTANCCEWDLSSRV